MSAEFAARTTGTAAEPRDAGSVAAESSAAARSWARPWPPGWRVLSADPAPNPILRRGAVVYAALRRLRLRR